MAHVFMILPYVENVKLKRQAFALFCGTDFNNIHELEDMCDYFDVSEGDNFCGAESGGEGDIFNMLLEL